MIMRPDYSPVELQEMIKNAKNKMELNEYIMLLAFKVYMPFMGVSFEELLINLGYEPATQLQMENMEQYKHERTR